MLTKSNQGEIPKSAGTSQENEPTLNQDQGDANLGPNAVVLDLGDLDKSKNLDQSAKGQAVQSQGDVSKSKDLDSNLEQSSIVKNPIIIMEDLTEDQDSNNSNEVVNANLLDVNNAFKQVPVLKSKATLKKTKSKSLSIERSNSESQVINSTYLDALRSAPKDIQNDSVIMESNDKFDNGIDLTNKNEVFKKAMELTMKGDSSAAAKYLKVYESLSNLDLSNLRPVTKRATSANPVMSDIDVRPEGKTDGGIFENGMWFFPNRITNYQNHSYTPYFDRNIKELCYPIPLTIFDKDWQNKSMGYHAKKKIKSVEGELKTEAYTGLPYADEWLLDYGDWSIHYNGYINALRNAKFTRFVDWSLAHKLNVEKVMSEMGWLTALNQLPLNRFCLLDETSFQKNPYVEGGERQGWDPATGKPPKKNEKLNQFQNKPYQKWNNDQNSNNQIASGSGSNEYNSNFNNGRPFEKKKFQRGYFGNNYNENYKDKKAAAMGKNKQPEK
ncbi:uncharacterized protein MELLADRAFT_109772 [Melampsora larici-populina 98AG31]|uniref:Uncharacterized protein n=1 Tax=Melampsora larici-populina (strain 98AG31 / pathotype 3-4-7) TaxID=747676 RepID=F4RXK9_MELLP|nr:uncharacterized protein MELLADRAFT_109772 [Melampsora larici-populina 98AG31]EGG02874.1 hypothetical protein MELLADRAFT_109772 [Melampsora larici-populina 98AG31]